MKLSDLSKATTERLGKVEKATSAEALAGTADKFPDAAGVKSTVDGAVDSHETTYDHTTYDAAVLKQKREELLAEATISLDFANNRYSVYDGIGNGMTLVPYETALTHTRGSEATGRGVGKLETVGVDTKRLVRDPETGKSQGLLIEEQRTNLLTGSAYASTALPTTNGVAPTFGPKSVVSGWDVEEVTDSAGSTTAGKMRAGLTGNSSVSFSATFGTKAPPSGYPVMAIVKTAPSIEVLARAVVDPENRTAYFVLGSGSIRVRSGSDFCRVTVSATLSPSDTYYVGLFPAAALTTSSTTNDPSLIGSVDVGSFQLEAGSFPTSYIPTEGSQVTRAADNCSRTLGAEFNPNEFTLFTEFRCRGVGAGSAATPLILIGTGGPATNAVWCGQVVSGGSLRVLSVSYQGQFYTFSASGSFDDGSLVRCAISYDGQRLTGVVNDGTPVQFDLPSPILGLATLRIGSVSSGNQCLNGESARAELLPRAYTATELQTLTAPEA